MNSNKVNKKTKAQKVGVDLKRRICQAQPEPTLGPSRGYYSTAECVFNQGRWQGCTTSSTNRFINL